MLFCVATGSLIVAVQLPKLTASFTALKNNTLSKIEIPDFRSVVASTPKPIEPQTAIASRLVVDLSDRKVSLYKNDKAVARYRIAIGQEGWETPTGSFQINQMYENPAWQHPITGEKVPPGKDNPLGKRWIGFAAHGKLLIGFHGTTDDSLIGQAVSHGCLRMKNADVIALYKEVKIGTSVVVKP